MNRSEAHTHGHDRGKVEAPKTPAQMWATFAGAFLLALGVLSLIIVGLNFGTVDNRLNQDFLIWDVSGWLTILWAATGALGLFMASRVDAARTWSIATGLLFLTMAVWGFIDGNDVASIFAAGTTDNITHAILGAVGLMVGMVSERKQREVGADRHAQPKGEHETHRAAAVEDERLMREERFPRTAEGAPRSSSERITTRRER